MGRSALVLASAPAECLASSSVCREDLACVTCLGEGAYGAVELVRHEVSGAFYALKVLPKALIRRARHAACLLDEVRAQGLCSGSPFVCRLAASFEDAAALYVLSEAAPDGPLLEEASSDDDEATCKALAPREARARLAELASAPRGVANGRVLPESFA